MNIHAGVSSDDLGKALLDPGAIFTSPEEVAANPGFSLEQKVEILRRWKYDAIETQVAEDEGMPDGDGDLLSQVSSVLRELITDLEARPPV